MLRLPILNMLLAYRETSPLSFHVPGHRNGRLLQVVEGLLQQEEFEEQLSFIKPLQAVMNYDVTELAITDDLHDPQHAIKEAQQLAASLYKTEHTIFLVGGSTAGNIAAILAICEPDDYIIIQRNVHKSVINGCKLAGVNVVFVRPQLDESSGYSTIPSLNTIERALKCYPQAKAVFLTSPNYYGISCNLTDYVTLVHQYAALLIVDEAHGAHYGFHPKIPASALQYGADIVIQSTHKTLPALTMCAMLHINSKQVDIDCILQQLAMIESSSPSFIMLASLDFARAIMEEKGQILIEQSLKLRDKLMSYLAQHHTILAIEEYDKASSSSLDMPYKMPHIVYDPLRLHLYDKTLQLSGYELQKLLENKGIWVEMATSKHCILLLHLGFTIEEYNQMLSRLADIERHLSVMLATGESNLTEGERSSAQSYGYENQRVSSYYIGDTIGQPVKMTRVNYNNTHYINIEEAVGQLSGEMLVPYPPGIPILYSGEQITAQAIDEIKHYLYYGAKFQGNEALYEGKIKILIN